ncbi:MAG: RHS repeat protein [Anaerolineae bacterium]|nr:RHS repeat protein [Anaerolineae bacterium]
MLKRVLAWQLILTLCLSGAHLYAYTALAPVQAQEDTAPCDDVRYLMANDAIPYLTPGVTESGGGTLEPTLTGELPAGKMADFWAFTLAEATTLELVFARAPDDALEFAVFRGSDIEAAYQPVRANTPYSFALDPAAYTLVVQRRRLADRRDLSYELSADFAGATDFVNARELSDESSSTRVPAVFDSAAGIERIAFPGGAVEVLTHLRAVERVGTYNRAMAHVIFQQTPAQGIFIGNWASQISFLGGSFAAAGTAGEGRPRIFYLERFNHAFNYGSGPANYNLNLLKDGGDEISIEWEAVESVWVLDACAGVKLKTGQRFVGELAPGADERRMSFGGAAGSFDIELLAPNAAGEAASYRFQIDLASIAPNGEEVALERGVLQALALPGGRRLRLEATDIALKPDGAPGPDEDTIPLAITLGGSQRITIDWYNIEALALVTASDGAPAFQIQFMDDERKARLTVRPADGFVDFSAQEDVVHVQYASTRTPGAPGAERLLLPADEGYIELVTPDGAPDFIPQAMPDQPGYMPRTLNNLGGECYPFNTITPEANCPPNGYPNPANGNLWYAVTDHSAGGGRLDLALTRSYNTYDHQKDGPFGLGWTAGYRVDYPVRFDEAANARVVDLSTLAYPAALDLTWAPRGLVIFTTASGSRHAFVRSEATTSAASPEVWQALAMPRWKLYRENIRAPWTLEQADSGLTYTFDRAGRLRGYGYPDSPNRRWITVTYPWETAIRAPGPVVVTDVAAQRQLELYFDADYHVVRSVLRDMTRHEQESDPAACDRARNCFEITYEYQNGLLRTVAYPDGRTASYDYDAQNRLVWHDDPRAPISPTMSYTYGAAESPRVASIYILDPGARTPGDDAAPWRALDAGAWSTDANSRPVYSVTMTDDAGARTYTYRTAAPAALPAEAPWRSGQSSFRLVQVTSPLDEIGVTLYEWSDGGLLTNIGAQKDGAEFALRNNIALAYTPTGDLKSIVPLGGYGAFVDIVQDGPAQTFAFDDLSTVLLNYDAAGRLASVEDRHGARYRYEWREGELVYTRENDGAAWHYRLNALGLPDAVAQRRESDESESAWYTVTYRWDGLGRLIGVTDPELGDYEVEYEVAACVACDYTKPNQTIRVTDPVGAVTVSRFDGRGRLIETCLGHAPDCAEFLRKTTYTYDAQDRLTGETRWLAGAAGAESQALHTFYTYTPVEALPGIPTGNEAIIKGYRVTRTDAYGRASSITYDALGRVRETSDGPHRAARYEYQANTAGEYYWQRPNVNLRVAQYDLVYGEITATTYYYFDLRWQLRRVLRVAGDEEPAWEFQHTATSTTGLLAMDFGDALSVQWSGYTGGSPQTVRYDDAFSAAAPVLSIEYDFLRRPVVVTRADDEATATRTVYCTLPNGGLRVLDSRAPAPPDFDCSYQDTDIANVAQARYYDAHGRLTLIQDDAGARAFTYRANPAPGRWEVSVETAPLPGHGAPLHWELHYDAAGDLIYWRDEAGAEHFYTYDTLGRLRRVAAPDEPEASFTFTYNAADRLTGVTDDLGRGTLYTYDGVYGRLVTAQDRSTGAVTVYTYDLYGRLSSVTTPPGSVTTYGYTDPHDPTRLTYIHTPAGVHRYDWDDAANRLTYTDPRGSVAVYSFDTAGRLWQIQDTAGGAARVYRLDYDAAGNLTAWERAAAQRFTLAYDPATYGVAVSEASLAEAWGWRFEATPGGRLKTVTNPARQSLHFDYNPLGQLTTVAAGALNWSIERADGLPQLSFTAPDESAALFFDALYRLRADGVRTYHYTYDAGAPTVKLQIGEAAGDRLYTFDPGASLPDSIQMDTPPRVTLEAPGHRITYTYDRAGRLVEIARTACVDPGADCAESVTATARIAYDASGRPVRVEDTAQGIEDFAYDAAGNLVYYHSFRDETYSYAYDDAGRLYRITGPAGVKLLLAYDSLDRVTGLCRTRAEAPDDYTACRQAGGELETYAYDALGRLVERAYSDAAVAYQYAPEGGGQLTAWSAAGGAPVTLSYTESGLSLLSRLDAGADAYTFSYQYTAGDPIRLAAANGDRSGGLAFEYDRDRIAAIDAAGYTTQYAYDPDGWSYEVAGDGHSMRFVLDARGFLSAVTAGDHTVSADYYLGHGEQTALLLGLAEDGELMLELTLDPAGGAVRSDYLAAGQSLTATYLQPAPQIVRRILEGEPGLFAQEAGGYDTQVAYNEAGQPLSMQVNDALSGALLYSAVYAYDRAGNLTDETHTYAGGVQRRIVYSYTHDRLVSRRVDIVAPEADAPAAYTFAYGYDAAGNVQEVRAISPSGEATTCATYRYDNANRLIEVQGTASRRYAYDAYNRLVSIDDAQRYVYQGTSDTPVLAVENGEAVYYAQLPGGPMLFEGSAAGIGWALHDGESFTFDTHDREPLWLLDPLGRLLSLATPPFSKAEDITPCDLLLETQHLSALARLQPMFDGMIWDPQTNLYFEDGRAYSPELGRYLQRATSLTYNHYAYFAQPDGIPARAPEPAFMTGLHVLRAALEAAQPAEPLTAPAVAVRYRPRPSGADADPFLERLSEPPALLQSSLTASLAFPDQLKAAYNLPGVQIDPTTGALALPLANAPGRGESTSGDAATYFAQLAAQAALPLQGVVAYNPARWRPALAGLQDTFYTAAPALDAAYSTLWDFLPKPLLAPERAADTLDLVDMITALPGRTGQDWLRAALTRALPTTPALPPADIDVWRAGEFEAESETGRDVPAPRGVPLYHPGVNPDWLYPAF